MCEVRRISRSPPSIAIETAAVQRRAVRYHPDMFIMCARYMTNDETEPIRQVRRIRTSRPLLRARHRGEGKFNARSDTDGGRHIEIESRYACISHPLTSAFIFIPSCSPTPAEECSSVDLSMSSSHSPAASISEGSERRRVMAQSRVQQLKGHKRKKRCETRDEEASTRGSSCRCRCAPSAPAETLPALGPRCRSAADADR
jgi:hypothetical protein